MEDFVEGDFVVWRRWEMRAWCCRGVRGACPPNFEGEGVRKLVLLLVLDDLTGVENIAIFRCLMGDQHSDETRIKKRAARWNARRRYDEQILWPARGLYAKEQQRKETEVEGGGDGGGEEIGGGPFIYSSPIPNTRDMSHSHSHNNHVSKF